MRGWKTYFEVHRVNRSFIRIGWERIVTGNSSGGKKGTN